MTRSLFRDSDDEVARALIIGAEWMDTMRKSNAEYESRTGEHSRVSERD